MDLRTQALAGKRVYLIGIKGTGMATLALWLQHQGAQVEGADSSERFYTDDLLAAARIPLHQGFHPQHLHAEIDLVVHSQAYDHNNCELARAQQLGLPLLGYPQALGQISARFPLAVAVTGVHGKTTSTLMLGDALQALGLPATVWAGGSNPAWNNSPLWIGGEGILVAEACEYRRHFLHFSANALLLLSLDWDHQDYYPSYHQLEQAFRELIAQLPLGAPLIYNADDPQVVALVQQIEPAKITLLPFGRQAAPPFTISNIRLAPGCNTLQLAGCPQPLPFHVPGAHLLQNAAGVMATAALLWSIHQQNIPSTRQQADQLFATRTLDRSALARSCASLPWEKLAGSSASFRGGSRRSEVLGQAGGILFLDDYAHHPTAISTTLRGFKLFYPGRRLVVDFIAHTYSRTRALWQEFIHCFDDADLLFLHDIYASAREGQEQQLDSSSFAAAIAAQRPPQSTYYLPTMQAGIAQLLLLLRPGDMLVSMGAGNNRQVAQSCLATLKAQ